MTAKVNAAHQLKLRIENLSGARNKAITTLIKEFFSTEKAIDGIESLFAWKECDKLVDMVKHSLDGLFSELDLMI